MRKSVWGAVTFSFGLLAACGASKGTPAAAGPDANSTAAVATDWGSICKAAKARAPRCGVPDQMVADCEKIGGCAEHPYDTSALPVLATCLADSDCDACTKAASASPSAAGKAFLAAAADYEKRCQRNDDLAALVTRVGGLFNADSLKPFSDCMQMPSCDDAATCNANLHMGGASVMANSQCTDVLGLGASSESASNIPPPPPPPPVDLTGQPAPELSADAISAKIPSIGSLKGKIVVVHFWASWCVPCNKTMPMLDAFAKKNKKKVVVIGISEDDDADAAKKFLAANKIKFLNGLDAQKQTAKAYTPTTMPMTFVIDRTGKVASVIPGNHFTAADLQKSL
jgi:thiol-disulfide isomerase/thioredoxin